MVGITIAGRYLYLPTLIYQTKWFDSSRPAKVHDIVYIKDLNPVRGQWKIGEIIHVENSKAPINVQVRYKNNTKFPTDVELIVWRDVKNLALIVPAEMRSELNPKAKEFVPKK